MSRAPAASKTAPAISRPVAIHGSAGNEAATLTRTFTGADPFAFMATTVQRPPVTGHDSVWVPGPVVFTVQIGACAGRIAGEPPACPRSDGWPPVDPVTVAYATPDR